MPLEDVLVSLVEPVVEVARHEILIYIICLIHICVQSKKLNVRCIFLELQAEKAARELHATAEISLSAVRCSKELGVDCLIHGTPAKEKLTSIASTTT
jgi:hypothetical protein